jgi:hypothetical protein
MINFRTIFIFLICAVTIVYGPLKAQASVTFFSGQLDYVEYDTGGVYSGTAIGTDFVGSIDDGDANGFISNGGTYTSFGCCIAAGGLSISNDMTLTAEDATFLNEIAGSVQYSAGDIVDSINIEGDKATNSGGRIEIGVSYILPQDSFDNEELSNYPVAQNEIELALFFIFEEDNLGEDIYSAGGKITASSPSDDFNYNRLLNGEYYGVDFFPDGYTSFTNLIFEGDGGITFNEIADSDGGPLSSGSRTYNVNSDGEINASSNNRGIVSFDGRFGFMADFEAIGGFNIFAKKSSMLSNSILNGEYYAINYFSDDYTDFMEVNFDGAGGLTYQTLQTSDDSPLESGSDSYTVSSDGQITIGDNKGVVSSDGQFAFNVDLAGIPGLVILIKKSSGLTTSILNGDYYSITSDSTGFVSFNETNFNGKGILKHQQLQKNNEISLESLSTSYTVSPDGHISIEDSGVRGVVSSDGRYVFIVGFGDTQEPPPGIDIFAKKFVQENKSKAMPWIPLLLLNEL